MAFWNLSNSGSRTALVCGESAEQISQAQLADAAEAVRALLQTHGPPRSLGFALVRNLPSSVLVYLGALAAGAPICLLPDNIPRPALLTLLKLYAPHWIAGCAPLPGYSVFAGELPYADNSGRIQFRKLERHGSDEFFAHPKLAVLLSTSGSTGSPKLVRLSYDNLASNAASIASFLELSAEERPITTLSMSYSYGLSVINSHLHVGAPIVLTDAPTTHKDFWSIFEKTAPTSIACVPYQYEATARSAFVPPERLSDKGRGIGVPIPDGALSIDDTTGELIYRGPNVMLGYAQKLTDLERGDDLNGTLATGDLAMRDDDGFYFVTGRLKRIAKILGYRINLDEAERLFGSLSSGVTACVESAGILFVFSDTTLPQAEVNTLVRDTLNLHPSVVRTQRTREFPRLGNGKLDYAQLLAMAKEQAA